MNPDALTLPLMPDFVSQLESHILREFARAVDGWSRCVAALTRWEDEHLLNHPSPEMLARHKATLDRLLRFGRFLALTTGQAEFPDEHLAKIVSGTQNALQDKLTMWHGQMPREEAERILKAVFNES